MRSDDIREGVRRLFTLRSRSPARIAAEADDELRALIEARVEHLTARGIPESEARAQAMARLGQPLADTQMLLHTSAIHRDRRMHLSEAFDDLVQDLRFAARTLRRDAAFTALAVAIIGLGIGASATVFSVANALLIRPLPFREPGDLIWIGNRPPGIEGADFSTQEGNFVDLGARNRSLSGLAAYNAYFGVGDTKLGEGSEMIRVSRVQVTPTFFPLLGVAPALGRAFVPEESADNASPVVMLSHSLWMRQFGADSGIVGRRVIMDGNAVSVVGVLPATFDFGSVFSPGAHIDLFTPFPLTDRTNRQGNTLGLVGRLKPGVSLTTAVSDLVATGAAITAEHPERNAIAPHVMSLRARVSGSAQSAVTMLLLAVGVVMLIVCANLSNLLLARAATRQKEMAVRAALGAGRRRLIRQMLTESVVLSSCGALLGLLVAILGTRTIAHTNAVALPLLSSVRVDATALAFIVVLAVSAGLVFGLAPALQLGESGVHDALKSSGRGTTDSKRGQWVRRSLVVSEIAFACMLLVGAGLLARSFLKLLDVDLGFAPERVVAVRIDPDRSRLTSQASFNAYVDEVLRLTREVRGVQSASVTDGLPLGGNRGWGISAAEHADDKSQIKESSIHVVGDGYLRTLGMTLIAGRDLTPQDAAPGQRVILINESAARSLWPGENPIGRLLQADRPAREVVGVVRDVRHIALDKPAGLEVYLPIRQTGDFGALSLVVRTTLTPGAFATAIRSALLPVNSNLPINEIQTLSELVDRSISPRKFFTSMLGGFSVFALGLALLGIYGVISYTVSRRTQEIGVRIALGASARQIQGRIIRETLELTAAGVALGTAGSWVLSRMLSGLLFGVSSTDPVTFAAMLAIVTTVALISGYLPARRASRIDPTVAFRST